MDTASGPGSRSLRPRRVAIAGGGIIGLAVARSLIAKRPGDEVVVLEKEHRLAAHQTGHNSGVVHAGLYYTPGSLKARLCVDGVAQLRGYCRERGIAYEECGKVVVALDEAEEPALHAIHERAVANGVPDIRMVGPDELRVIEPHAVGRLALHSPRTAIVDFPGVARHLAEDVRAAGGHIRTGTAVDRVEPVGRQVAVHTAGGGELFDAFVNCAGLHADRLAVASGDEPTPRIVPFRGEYYRLAPARRHLCRGLIYPVPDPAYPFLGVHLTKRVDGEVLVGPNAVLAFSREGYHRYDVRPRDLAETLRWPGFHTLAKAHWRMGASEMRRSLSRSAFAREAARYVPGLTGADLEPALTGVRAQALDADGSLVDDFRITTAGRAIHVRNAPSPAATSSLAIAEHIVGEGLLPVMER